MPKSSAALGFWFELLNSDERFRAIMAFLFENANLRMKYFVICTKACELSQYHADKLRAD